jgi:hypothetical protein
MSVSIRSALCLAALLGAAVSVGCDSIDQAVMDPCSSNRKAVQLAENKISGLRQRNVGRETPIYRLGVRDLRRTREILVTCKVQYGDRV